MMRNNHHIFFTIIMIAGLYLGGCSGLAYVAPEEESTTKLEPVDFILAATSTPISTIETPAADFSPTPVVLEEPQAGSIDISTEAIPASSFPEPERDSNAPLAVVQQNMNIRSGPNTGYPVIGVAASAETFTVLGRNEDSSWIQVAHPVGEQAWLYAELVEISGDLQSVPFVQMVSPAETELQPVVASGKEPQGTIYFVADKVESLGYFDPATGGSVDLKVEGVKSGIFKLTADGANLTQIHPSMANDNHLAISPDGQKMLYQVEAGLDIYLSNLDGNSSINLTNSPNLGEDEPVWLPDGQRIIYLQAYDSFKRLPGDNFFSDLYMVDAKQAVPLNLTNHSPGRRVDNYAVSPDGQQVIFVSGPTQGMEPPSPDMNFVRDQPETLSIVNLADFQRFDLITNPPGYELRELSWSPDSQRIALTIGVQQADGGFRYDVHLVNPDGTGHQNITNTADAFESNPVWSPNGQQLAVACDYSHGGIYSNNKMTGIQFFGRDGTIQTGCLDLPDTYAAVDLKWSPDGQRVAILGVRHLVDGELLSSPQTKLFTIRPDGTELIQVADPDQQIGWEFAWSPDGQWLAFAATSGLSKTGSMFTSAQQARTAVEYKIYVSQVDGSRTIPLTEGEFGHITQIEWQP